MNKDLYIRNGRVITETGEFDGGLIVNDGKIGQLVHGNPDIDAQEVIDASGQLILPGIIDPHVHFSEPRPDPYEGFLTGTRAAAASGITTVVEMPLNASPPTSTRSTLTGKGRSLKPTL